MGEEIGLALLVILFSVKKPVHLNGKILIKHEKTPLFQAVILSPVEKRFGIRGGFLLVLSLKAYVFRLLKSASCCAGMHSWSIMTNK